ncbi:MAG: class I SAM-dependent methyltransferase [Ignavibacteria bacterium]
MPAGNKPHYLDPEHPNYIRWKRSRDISFERGRFVKTIVSKYKSIRSIKVLDIGSGFGGTVQNFLDDTNQIYSIEIDEFKLSNQPEHKALKKFNCDAFKLPFEEKFDVIILQDFIEHIERPKQFFFYIKNFLKDDGIIYISTPNRLSIINLIADPHWGFPVISMLSRKVIKKFFIPIFRRKERNRNDIAELLSLKKLKELFSETGFKFNLHTVEAVQTLFENPHQIIWSDFHLFLLKLIKPTKVDQLIKRIANNKTGFLNKYITPTFFMILKKH